MADEQMIPLSRLNEVIAQRDALRAELDAANAQLQTAQQEREQERQTLTQEHESGLAEVRQQMAQLTEQFAAAQQQLESERVGNWRLRAATEAGLDARLADRLRGDDYEALLADAAALREALPVAAPGNLPRAAGTRPAQVTAEQMRDPAWVRENMHLLMNGQGR